MSTYFVSYLHGFYALFLKPLQDLPQMGFGILIYRRYLLYIFDYFRKKHWIKKSHRGIMLSTVHTRACQKCAHSIARMEHLQLHTKSFCSKITFSKTNVKVGKGSPPKFRLFAVTISDFYIIMLKNKEVTPI